jgi:hypothetical protein
MACVASLLALPEELKAQRSRFRSTFAHHRRASELSDGSVASVIEEDKLSFKLRPVWSGSTAYVSYCLHFLLLTFPSTFTYLPFQLARGHIRLVTSPEYYDHVVRIRT